MALPKIFPFIKEVASNKPNAATAFTLNSAAPTGFTAFDTRLSATNQTCFYTATNGTDWEEGSGTWDDTAKTLTRTTVYRSTNSDAAVDFSAGADVTVRITFGTMQALHSYIESRAAFMGGTASLDGTTGVQISAGAASLNGIPIEWTGAITTGAIGGIAADTLYYIYLYSSSGTATLEASTTAPAYDADLGYWIKTGDSTRRCVAAWKTKSGSAVFQKGSWASNAANTRERSFSYADDPGDLSAPATWSNTSWATASNFSTSGFCPVNASEMLCSIMVSDTATAPVMSGGAVSSKDLNGETATFCGDLYARLSLGVASQVHLLHPAWIPYATTLYTRAAASTTTCTFRVHGWKLII